MLYHLIYPLRDSLLLANVFKYITTRSFIAFAISLILAIVLGKPFINLIKRKQFGQFIREAGPESHKKKSGTPTMGGVLIMFCTSIGILICGNFNSLPLVGALIVITSFFILGFVDDYMIIAKKSNKGVSGKFKLVWQFITSFLVCYWLVSTNIISSDLYLPFVKDSVLNLGLIGFMLFGSLVIVGSSNAVNLTDGLDGLAIGPVVTSLITLAIFSYLGGNIETSKYLLIPYISGLGEVTVLCSALVGACVGFLWFNTYPAQIFMGDVGSLSLGGALGIMSVLGKNEFLLFIFGGIFVIEALSVIIQVFSFKTRGKRVFKMAPIHHHFELKGWQEPKVIVRFWILSLLFMVLALISLKIR